LRCGGARAIVGAMGMMGSGRALGASRDSGSALVVVKCGERDSRRWLRVGEENELGVLATGAPPRAARVTRAGRAARG